MRKNMKLELTWAGKDAQIRPEPRILMEDKAKSYGDKDSANMLIHGDNLLALKSLEATHAGQVKCIYIDPPYNTGNAFEHYDDGYEHSIWLSLMRDRLEILRNLLSDDGSIWISIDDSEQAYLKVLMDEVFGRENFLTDVIWNSTKSVTNTAIISTAHTHNLVFFKNKEFWVKNRTDFRLPEDGEGFSNPDNDLRGPWKADPFQVGGWRPNQQYEITNPKTGKVYLPNKGSSWKNEFEKFKELMADGRIVFGKNGDAGPQRKRFLSEALERGKVATTLWIDLDTTTNGTQHSKDLFGTNPFTNPKPENLIQRILDLSTKPGDLVLDSFLGSGTTAAVAHKMGRRWIGIELGDHAYTHCIPRLQKVIDGTDTGGITKAVDWKGGGGFKFYELASSLIVKDEEGNLVISKEYNADMLSEAMCKLMGYRYEPDKSVFWKQGRGTENNYIFTTTMVMTAQYLEEIQRVLGNDTLTICCSAFIGNQKDFPNITIKRIPQVVLDKCEWNKPGYPLPVREDFTEEDFEF